METTPIPVKARIIDESEVIKHNAWPRFENFIISDTAHSAALKNKLYSDSDSNSEYEKEIIPVIKTVEALGFEDDATLIQIINRGKSLGLDLLNPKLAISFAKNMNRIEMGAPSNMRVAMEPMRGSYKDDGEGSSLIFSISYSMIYTISASPTKPFKPTTPFLFIK